MKVQFNSIVSRVSQVRTEYLIGVYALLSWLAINMLFSFIGIDWVNNSDSGWYLDVALNLTPFDSAVVIGYPLLWRALIEIVPDPSLTVTMGQIINVICFVGFAVITYWLMITLNIQQPALAALLIIFVPLTGVTSVIQPRANALLLLLVFSSIWLYATNRSLLFALVVSLIPLVHRSALPFVGMIVLIALWERRIRLRMLLIIVTPLAIYWLIGISQGQDLIWYLRGYANNDSISGLPLFDGLIGTLILGVRGSMPDLLQGTFLGAYVILAIFLLIKGVWHNQKVLLALIVPPIFLVAVQPADEVWAAYNYTRFLLVPTFLFFQGVRWYPPGKAVVSHGIVIFFFITQVIWSLYTVWYGAN